MLGLIISLAFKNNYCYASNDYLAQYTNSSTRTITYSLSKLKKLNYIIIKYENNIRKIYLNNEKIPLKSSIQSAKNCYTAIEENCDHNINNKYKKNNKNNFKKEDIPYWMDHPEVCRGKKATKEEIEKMEELLKEFKRED